jgi:Flp pilus assembly protein TadD
MLGWVHRRRLWVADTWPATVFALADDAVQRAIALAPNQSLALAGVGFSRFWFHFDWAGGEQAFKLASQSNPSESNARWGLAFLMLTQGRVDEGFLQLRTARELDPLSPVMHTLEAAFLTAAGRYGPARQRLATALDIAPNLWLAHAALGRLLAMEGKVDDGLVSLRRAVELAPDSVRPRAHLGAQLAALGQFAEARALLEQMQRRAGHTYVPPTSLAMVHAALGDTQAALDQLDRAYEARDTRLVELKGDPSWNPIRNEPRFAALTRKLGLEGIGAALSSV